MKHRWGEPQRKDCHTTRRVCVACGLVKVSRHEPENNPQHWTEWERAGARFNSDKTPACENNPHG